jgi:Fic family protein
METFTPPLYIEERKKEYYKALMHGQQRGQSEKLEIIDKWVIFFLDCLQTLTQRLTEKREAFITLKDYLNERQKQILAFLTTNSPAQVSDILQNMPQIPHATLKRDLTILMEKRLLTQVGNGRGVRYFVQNQ